MKHCSLCSKHKTVPLQLSTMLVMAAIAEGFE